MLENWLKVVEPNRKTKKNWRRVVVVESEMLTFLSFGRYDFLEEISSNHPWKTDLEQSLPYVFDSFLLVSVSPLLLFSKQCSLQLYNTKNLYNRRFCNAFYITFNSKKSEFFQFFCFFLDPSDFFQFEFICSYFWNMRNLQEQVEKELSCLNKLL